MPRARRARVRVDLKSDRRSFALLHSDCEQQQQQQRSRLRLPARLTTVPRLTGGSICRGSLIAPPAVNEPNGTHRARDNSVRAETRVNFRFGAIAAVTVAVATVAAGQIQLAARQIQANLKGTGPPDGRCIELSLVRSSATIKRRSSGSGTICDGKLLLSVPAAREARQADRILTKIKDQIQYCLQYIYMKILQRHKQLDPRSNI